MHIFLKVVTFLIAVGCALQAEEEPSVQEQTPAIVKPHTPTPSYFEDTLEKEKASDGRFVQELGNMVFALAGILTVIFIASWFLKRMLNSKIQQVNETSPVKILERRSLSPKTSIYLLEIAGKKIAIAEASNGITNLGEVPNIEEPKESTPSFQNVYDDKMRKG